jgi:hypothetical protein
MPRPQSSEDLPGPEPRRDTERETQQAIIRTPTRPTVRIAI